MKLLRCMILCKTTIYNIINFELETHIKKLFTELNQTQTFTLEHLRICQPLFSITDKYRTLKSNNIEIKLVLVH